MNANGSGRTQLTFNTVFDFAPRLSPDGSTIAFVHADPNYHLYLMNTDGSNLRRLTADVSGLEFNPAWSPDGTRISFSYVAEFNGPDSGFWVINVDGTGLNPVWTNANVSGGRPGSTSSWSPGGDFLLVDGVPLCCSDVGIFRVNVDGSNLRLLSPVDQWAATPDVSPDGQRIVFIGERTWADPLGVGWECGRLRDGNRRLRSDSALAARSLRPGANMVSDGNWIAFQPGADQEPHDEP